MERPKEILERAQAAARRLGRSSPAERPDAVAGLARALYRRRGPHAGGGPFPPGPPPATPAYPPADPDASAEQRVTLGGLRAELADELAKLATRREPPARG